MLTEVLPHMQLEKLAAYVDLLIQVCFKAPLLP